MAPEATLTVMIAHIKRISRLELKRTIKGNACRKIVPTS
jgi:hypothetical protein